MFAEKESLPFYMKEESIPLDKQNEIFYKQEILKKNWKSKNNTKVWILNI